VYNIGYHGVDSARVVVSVFDKYNKARPIASAMLDTIPVDGSKSTLIPISTSNFSRRVTLQVNVSPSKKFKDLVLDNNNAYYSFNVTGTGAAGIRFFADGEPLMDGDYVAARPTLVIRIPDGQEGGNRQVDFFVDDKPYLNGVPRDDDLTFSPQLSAGSHNLRIRAIEANTLGFLDTLQQDIKVSVSSALHILNLYNYPNPFARDTYFSFELAGSVAPDELSVRIFTIAGRRIKEIVLSQSQIHVGFNRVYWDGRDSDGDELANGYYFYQVTVKGGGKTETSIEKLAKLR
jgi:hypothetical protein